MKLRGYLAVAIVCLCLLVSDLVQRLLISPWIKLRPSRRVPVLGRWIQLMAILCTRPVVRIGGARIPVPPRIVPAEPGVLILMNHQSLFDIPLVVQMVDGGYPRIVTRARYERYIPLISHMVRLYQYPVVDPAANRHDLRRAIAELGEAGRTSDVPIAVFPEGTRTRDGEIGRFRSAGIKKLLAVRPWTVYVFVADGFWRAATFRQFLSGAWRIDGRVAHVRTLEWTDPNADAGAFVAECRRLMLDGLVALRADEPVEVAEG